MPMTRVQAIKTYFGDKRPVTNTELMALKAKDDNGVAYLTTLGDGALEALGETLLEKPE